MKVHLNGKWNVNPTLGFIFRLVSSDRPSSVFYFFYFNNLAQSSIERQVVGRNCRVHFSFHILTGVRDGRDDTLLLRVQLIIALAPSSVTQHHEGGSLKILHECFAAEEYLLMKKWIFTYETNTSQFILNLLLLFVNSCRWHIPSVQICGTSPCPQEFSNMFHQVP